MNVHLIRSNEFCEESFNDILEFLQSFDGPIRFFEMKTCHSLEDSFIDQVDEKKFYKQEINVCHSLRFTNTIPAARKTARWNNMFALCRQARSENHTRGNDLVILLTDIANENNWFCMLDPTDPVNGFIHTAEWEHYVNCSAVFPIAYLGAGLILQKHMFSGMGSFLRAVHERPLGCVNDFCENKRDIILKLRTADVCIDCMHRLKKRLEPLVINQLINILEGVRLRMLFSQNFRQNLAPSKLKITADGNICLPDYGNIEIRLTPLEKTLYLFFLNYPEGLMLRKLKNHKEELRAIYEQFSTSGLMAEIHNKIDGLVDIRSNSLSEKMSKIKASFRRSIGNDLAKPYYIQGEQNGVKRIPLERGLVENGFVYN